MTFNNGRERGRIREGSKRTRDRDTKREWREDELKCTLILFPSWPPLL